MSFVTATSIVYDCNTTSAATRLRVCSIAMNLVINPTIG